MKKLFLLASMMVAGLTSFAQTATIEVEDFNIEAPGTTDVNFVLNCDEDLMDMTVYVKCPEGLAITKVALGPGHDGNGSPKAEVNVVNGDYQISSFDSDLEGQYKAGEVAWVCTFEAAEGFTGGECSIYNGNGGGMTINYDEYAFADGTFNVTVGGAEPKTYEVTIPAIGKGTLTADVALDFTDTGINAYIVNEVTATKYVKYTQVFQVPAGTPIVVEGATGEVNIIESAEAIEGNLLAAGDGAAHAGGYAMSSQKGTWKKLNATVTVPVGKAYIPADVVPAAAKSSEFLYDFDGDATAIESINAEQSNAPMYNLNGVRVYNAQKGVYIQNGRKVLK